MRVQRAKCLLDDTALLMTEIAIRSGFGSLRRFNAVFRTVYKRAPIDIRRAGLSPARTQHTFAEAALRAAPGHRNG
jgi:AraC family transcriptional regulator of adaptative response/methylated-DNA-[protein]-cysteine methyltransferase